MPKWEVQRYPSGTVVVIRTESDRQHPHYYVGGCDGVTDSARGTIAEELNRWLNDGTIPWWFHLSKRDATQPEVLITPWGTAIIATGPTVESEPGRGDWTSVMTADARIARGLLIESIIKRRWIE